MCDDSYRKKHKEERFKVNWHDDFSHRRVALPQTFIRRYEQVIYGIHNKDEEICQKNLRKGFAVVKLQIAEQTVTQVIKKLRYSKADYISNLGKCKRFVTYFPFLFYLIQFK